MRESVTRTRLLAGDTAGHWRDPRPRLAVADGQSKATDPRHSPVRVVDAESLKETLTIAVEGQPFTIVAAGGSGASH